MGDISDGDHPAAHIRSEALPPKEIDDLFDYDVGLDEVLKEIAEKPSVANVTAFKQSATAPETGLGLDEEVKVSKKRQPIAKLDESRLLSQAGIPRLRSAAKTKLKFKGKGHEFSDAARLLNFYQLWLDDLFPRAKFVDGLAIIEKLGHSKRIQVMRREWIDEERPKLHMEDDGPDKQGSHSLHLNEAPSHRLGNLAPNPNDRSQKTAERHLARDKDSGQSMKTDASSAFGGFPIEGQLSENNARDDGRLFFSEDEGVERDATDGDVTGEDDLEAILAEQEVKDPEPGRHSSTTEPDASLRPLDENFEDGIEAIMGLDAAW